jgi:hypothetical protein
MYLGLHADEMRYKKPTATDKKIREIEKVNE